MSCTNFTRSLPLYRNSRQCHVGQVQLCQRTNRILGPLMFFFYSKGEVFILVNMFLSIIIENFKEWREATTSNLTNTRSLTLWQSNLWVGWDWVRDRFSKIGFLPKGISIDMCTRRENGLTKLRNWRTGSIDLWRLLREFIVMIMKKIFSGMMEK